VVLDDSAATVAPSELVDWCTQRLARFKIPAHVLPVTAEELPTSASGKIQKFVLAERAQQLLTV
jgi:fatty-acyl-CoA synthase